MLVVTSVANAMEHEPMAGISSGDRMLASAIVMAIFAAGALLRAVWKRITGTEDTFIQ